MIEKNLSIIRGDTKTLYLTIKNNGVAVTDLEKVYLTIKKDFYTDNFIIQKKLDSDILLNTDNEYEITINSYDTDEMDYGRYVYDVEIIKGNLKKTVAKGDFTIKVEATFVGNEG